MLYLSVFIAHTLWMHARLMDNTYPLFTSCVFPQDMHVISTDENQVFAAVQEWNQNDTYNLYISDTRGVYFTLALENVQSSRGPEGNVMIDLYEVCQQASVVPEDNSIPSTWWNISHLIVLMLVPWTASLHFREGKTHRILIVSFATHTIL
jgi:hypothetical protein